MLADMYAILDKRGTILFNGHFAGLRESFINVQLAKLAFEIFYDCVRGINTQMAT